MNPNLPVDHIVDYLLDVLKFKSGKLPDRIGNSWQQLYNLANIHKIYYYIAARSLDYWSENIPENLQGYVKKSLVANKTRNILLTIQIEKLAGLFREAGIPIMFIKGVACLVRGIYPLETRYLSDIDVLIPTQYIKQSCDLIVSAGYAAVQNSVVPSYHHHIVPYTHPEHVGIIEIHIEPYDHTILDGPVMPLIWEKAETLILQGEEITVPCITDHVWILIRTSGSGRMFVPRLSETLEMSLIIGQNYSVDYDVLKDRARKNEMPRLVDAMSYSCSRYFDVAPFIPVDDRFFQQWVKWSLRLRQKLLGDVNFLTSRKRFGSLTFLTLPGIIPKFRYLRWLIRYELLEDFPDSAVLRVFFPLIKLWRIIKNVVTYIFFTVEYKMCNVMKKL